MFFTKPPASSPLLFSNSFPLNPYLARFTDYLSFNFKVADVGQGISAHRKEGTNRVVAQNTNITPENNCLNPSDRVPVAILLLSILVI